MEDLELEELYLKLAPRLRAYAVRLGLPRDEAEAAVHDAFVALLLAKRPIDDPVLWLWGATRNCAVNYRRKEERIQRLLAMPEERYVPSPRRRMELRRFVRRIPRLQLSIVVLRARGWRMKRIADRFGITVSWAEKQLRRARKTAAEEVDPNRSRVGRRVPSTDTFMSRRMIPRHVRPVRGPLVPRAPARPAVLRPHGRPARQVRRELPAARGLVQASRRIA